MLLAFVSGAPALAFMIFIIFGQGYSSLTIYTIAIVVVGVYLICFSAIYKRVVRPWQVVSNLISALTEQDYTLRAKYSNIEDPLGLSFSELNEFADHLQNQRLDVIETHQLLFIILQEIEAAVLCFNQDNRLVMANRYAQGLYKSEGEALLGRTANELGLKEFIGSNLQTAYEIEFPARKSRWLVKHNPYREKGLPHVMLLVADLQGPLREEELDAWKKLIRVLGHELNNSMTPLKSMTTSLSRILKRDPLPEDWKEDMSEGLSVIGRRVDGLSRFMEGYSRLARMPRPQKAPIQMRRFMERVTRFDPRFEIELLAGPDCMAIGDEGQLEQVLINLLKNAIEASDGTEGKVYASWEIGEKELLVKITDEGHGLASEDNLFVPFFSTKTTGSGIGLTLSQQIAEAHDGRITLENREDRSGCIATLILPIAE